MKEQIISLKSRLINGVSPAMATPLDRDGYRVDTAVTAQLVEFLIESGVKGLFVGGTTGEGILLDGTERMRLHQSAVEAAQGRVPILVHVGANRTDETTALARHGVEIGADAIVAVTPYFYPMDEDSLLAYFKAVAAAAPKVPLMAYDIPHMAVNAISPTLLRRLCAEIPSMAGIKSSRKDANEVRQLIDASPDYLTVLAGNESVALGMLSLGAHGLISGLSTAMPEPFTALTAAVANGDVAAARQIQKLINQLLGQLPAGKRIGAVKRILTERDIPMGPPVPPRPAVSDPLWPSLQATWNNRSG